MGKKFSMTDEEKDEFKNDDLLESTPKESTKKPNSDYIRLDLKPFGYDLKAYVNERCGELSKERDKKISTTAFIQELIINDMEQHNGVAKKKLIKKETNHDKVVKFLEELDDKKLSALITLLDIQL